MKGYYDSLLGGPIPCRALHRTNKDAFGFELAAPMLIVKVTTDARPYEKGQVLRIAPRDFIRRARSRRPHITVETINTSHLPVIDTDITCE